MGEHYQCRRAKRFDGKKIVTLPLLGKMYADGRKTLKSCHNLDKAIAAAKEFNNILPPEDIGLVIVSYKASSRPRTYTTSGNKQALRKEVKRPGSTQWLRFIDRKGEVFEVNPKTRHICENV